MGAWTLFCGGLIHDNFEFFMNKNFIFIFIILISSKLCAPSHDFGIVENSLGGEVHRLYNIMAFLTYNRKVAEFQIFLWIKSFEKIPKVLFYYIVATTKDTLVVPKYSKKTQANLMYI